MDKQTLLSRVNARALKRYNVEVTERMLRDWVSEKMLPRAKSLGRKEKSKEPNWQWNCGHYRRILQICRIMQTITDRKTGIRIELWFRGIKIPFVLLKEAFIEEFERLRKNRMKQITSEFDPDKDHLMTNKRRSGLINQIGELPPEFKVADFELSGEEKIKMLQKVGGESPKIDINLGLE